MKDQITITEGESLYTLLQIRDVMDRSLLTSGTTVGTVFAISYYYVDLVPDAEPTVTGPFVVSDTLKTSGSFVEWDLDTTGANFEHTASLNGFAGGHTVVIYYLFLVKREITDDVFKNPYQIYERRVQIEPLR